MNVRLSLTLLLLIASSFLSGYAIDSNDRIVVPKVNVEVESELKSLASGYEKAFKELSQAAKFIIVKTHKGVKSYGSIRSLKAFDGVLLIQIKSGATYCINPSDVVMLTNKKPSGAAE